MWQGDTFKFRIRGVGKVYVTSFTDDCSRYQVKSKVYLHKDAASAVNALRWALRSGRIPREIYLDNGRQFVSKIFKSEAQNHGIKLIFGSTIQPAWPWKDRTVSQDSLPGTYCTQGIPFVKPLQAGTLELRPPVQQLGESRRSWAG